MPASGTIGGVPRPAYDLATVEDALTRWAAAALTAGGSLNRKSYDAWYSAQPEPRPPSGIAVAKHLRPGAKWAEMILAARAAIVAVAVDRAVAVEVPVECSGRGWVVWERRGVEAWLADARCRCATCAEPTVGAAYPELVPLLVSAESAARAVSIWVQWRVCAVGDPAHRPVSGPAEAMAAGALYCGACRSKDTFYRDHPPGSVVPGRRRAGRSALEAKVAAALSAIAPHLGVEAGAGVSLPPGSGYHGMYALTPDLVIPARRAAVELDGGDGRSARYSRHDTDDGAADDAWRDRLLGEVGWSVLRVRHPDAAVLVDSPARIIATATSSATRIAGLIVEALTD